MIIVDAVGIILCIHIAILKAKAIKSCALITILDAVDIILCIHIVI